MAYVLLFVTSPLITLKHIRELNKTCNYDDADYDFFVLARHDINSVTKPGTTEVDDDRIETFDDTSVAEMQEYYELCRSDPIKRWVNMSVFAVLDERSTRDQTLVVHYEHTETDEGGEPVNQFWTSWRVRYSEGEKLISLLTFKVEFYYDTFSKSDRFLTEDGVFQVEFAIKKTWQEIIEDSREPQIASGFNPKL